MTSIIRGNDEFNTINKLIGKNKIINGNFDIWQRGVSQTSNGYGSDDRWFNINSGTTKTHSREDFILGQTEVPGNPKRFSRTVVNSVAGANNYCQKTQLIESVRTFAGQIVTLSFWAKADSNKNMAIDFLQFFGSSGSPSSPVNLIGKHIVELTTSWTKYIKTFSVPSIEGKVLGTDNNDYLRLRFWFDAGSTYSSETSNLGQQSGTFDISQVQLEEGESVTEFEKRDQGEELRLCQRYYEAWKVYSIVARNNFTRSFVASGSNFIVEKRVVPVMTYISDYTSTANSVSGYSSGISYTLSSTKPSISTSGMIGFFQTNVAVPSTTEAVVAQWEADAEL